MKITYLLATAVTCLMTGCGIKMPVGTSLGPPALQPTRIDRHAWIAPVEMRATDVPNREAVVEGFTTSLREYVAKGGYFTQVTSLPGRPSGSDVILTFRIDRYELRRSVHPLNIPLGLLTLSFYYWFGGPVAIDTSDVDVELVITSVSGEPLASARKTIQEEKNISVWSAEYMLPSGIEARTQLFADILNDATNQLRGKEGLG